MTAGAKVPITAIETLLSVDEIAFYNKSTPALISRLMDVGQLPFILINGRRYSARADIDAYNEKIKPQALALKELVGLMEEINDPSHPNNTD